MNPSVSVRDLFRSLFIALFLMLVLVAVSRGQDTPPTALPTPVLVPVDPPEKTSAPNVTATPAPTPVETNSGLRRLDAENAPTPVATPGGSTAVAVPSEPTSPPAKSRRSKRSITVHGRVDHGDERVGLGNDSYLAKGEEAGSVVAVFGSATSDGTVRHAVVSVLGDSRVTGPVGQDVIAVLGDVYINSEVRGQAVAVLGNVELGPLADVGGDVVVVGGTLKKDPAAITRGGVHPVGFAHFSGFAGLRAWFSECFLYGRLLAFGPHLGWAWSIALCLLVFYVLLALLFRGAVERCVETLEQRPGATILAAFITILATPIVWIVLSITVVGLIAVPFVVIGLFLAGLFGRAVMLAWIGRRFSKTIPLPLAVLIGGAVVLGLYLVPALSFVVYFALKLMGLGVVIFTLILLARREKPAAAVSTSLAETSAMPMSIPASDGFTGLAIVEPAVIPSTISSVDAPMELPLPPAPDPMVAPIPPPLLSPPPFVSPIIPAATLPRAGFWIRTASMLIDLILVGIVLGPFKHGSVFFLGIVTYAAVMWKLKGTTVGGIICGLKVVRLDDRAIDWPTAIVRALGCILSLAVACLGFIWVAFDDQRQSWHDKIGGTVVVKMPRGVSLV